MRHRLSWALLGGLVISAWVGGAAAQDLPPPGDCTAAEHRALQDAVDAACKIPRRCSGAQNCGTLLSNYNKNVACADARDAINATCFRGGNPGHRMAAQEARNAAQRCSVLMVTKRCKDCP